MQGTTSDSAYPCRQCRASTAGCRSPYSAVPNSTPSHSTAASTTTPMLSIGVVLVFPAMSGCGPSALPRHGERSEEHTSELQSLMRISYAVFCLKKKKNEHHEVVSTSKNTK